MIQRNLDGDVTKRDITKAEAKQMLSPELLEQYESDINYSINLEATSDNEILSIYLQSETPTVPMDGLTFGFNCKKVNTATGESWNKSYYWLRGATIENQDEVMKYCPPVDVSVSIWAVGVNDANTDKSYYFQNDTQTFTSVTLSSDNSVVKQVTYSFD